MLEELRGDVQTTLGELRELAHGIYPPLLRDRGLAEALRTAANRAVLPTEVISEGIERYPSETEAAVYFCCLEAMQNAGKHAGEDASITVTITGDDEHLDFCVADTGPGFDAGVAGDGPRLREHARPARRGRRHADRRHRARRRDPDRRPHPARPREP